MTKLGADTLWPIWADTASERAFTLEDAAAAPERAVVTAVAEPVLLGFAPAAPNGRAMLVLGGGGYVALMAGREGVQVARWLTGLGYHAFVLIHRFPDATTGPSAPLDDARAAMRRIRTSGAAPAGLGVVGLSSGGHLAACLAAEYPAEWREPPAPHGEATTRPDVLVVGYGPLSTNAKGRTLRPDKPPLPPAEKQALYDRLQPDAQLLPAPPPMFIVYSGNDAVVPVENALRLYGAARAAGAVADLHVFGDAPHGFALDTPGLPVSAWPGLCEAWLRQVGFL
ncbi:alpha/beta hydrolase [Sphingomonas sp. H39-1-10]|uniref:alpha/beta hydrolase n=1 Tax=Sphingomonas pollutisoli TaxID=3030829 RepID=UPI0023BA2646|nr:alpha/beta hydrolase [Sphingomonas pollutisoli]MDF0487334.1 alpha/beta hydrolase [Sphingomonas pollutisoli]